jgi:hypothetical protein
MLGWQPDVIKKEQAGESHAWVQILFYSEKLCDFGRVPHSFCFSVSSTLN